MCTGYTRDQCNGQVIKPLNLWPDLNPMWLGPDETSFVLMDSQGLLRCSHVCTVCACLCSCVLYIQVEIYVTNLKTKIENVAGSIDIDTFGSTLIPHPHKADEHLLRIEFHSLNWKFAELIYIFWFFFVYFLPHLLLRQNWVCSSCIG